MSSVKQGILPCFIVSLFIVSLCIVSFLSGASTYLSIFLLSFWYQYNLMMSKCFNISGIVLSLLFPEAPTSTTSSKLHTCFIPLHQALLDCSARLFQVIVPHPVTSSVSYSSYQVLKPIFKTRSSLHLYRYENVVYFLLIFD